MKRLLLFLMILCMAVGMVACSSEETIPEQPKEVVHEGPALYCATSENGGTVYLIGSVHVGSEDMYPLPDYITNAFEASDALAVEFDVRDEMENQAVMTKLLPKMLYADGTTIKDHISQELYEDAKAILQENHSYLSFLDQYIPSLWSNFIDTFMIEKSGYEAENGVDMYFLNLADELKKPIRDIESMESQLTMLIDFSPALQAELLEGSVESYRGEEELKQQLSEMLEVWKNGEEEQLIAMLNEEEEVTAEEQQLLDEYNKIMLTDRNVLMADYAEAALKDGEKLFICVGSAHVYGEDGMVDLLRERGYTVKRV
ncbi:MAG: TraB/GumN family protein [Clostridia bacterium]|nr:TraB/GumN family protein [Clostridia bacterium]